MAHPPVWRATARTAPAIQAAAYPSLSGQHATSTAAQLRLYATGERTSDGGIKVMRDIARSLEDCQDGGGCEIEAIASYIQGLN